MSPTEKYEQQPGPAGAPLRQWLPLLVACAIVVVTWAAFATVRHNAFILWDDNGYIFENEHLADPLSESIPYFFGQNYFIGNYHPLTMTAYALLFRIGGASPAVFHTASLLLHLLNVLLVFWFAWLLSGRRLLVAAIVSLFFGIHPMHVESVAWAAELKDVLYTAFFMAGLIAYLEYTAPPVAHHEGKRRLWLLGLTFVCFLLSVLSKPAAVIFPLVLPVIDLYTGRKTGKRDWLEKLPFAVVALVFGIIALVAQHAHHLVRDHYPLTQRLVFASSSTLAYIIKLVAPAGLSDFYPYPISPGELLPFVYYAAPVAIILQAYAINRTYKYTRVVAFGFLFYLVTIALELQLVSVGDAMMADRYTYVPYIGLFFMLAVGADWLCRRGGIVKPVLLSLLGALAASCAWSTHARCKTWKDNETIARDLYRKYPGAPIAAHNMATVLYGQKKYREAIPMFRDVIKAKPDYVNEYLNLANAYIATDAADSAFTVLESVPPGATADYYGFYFSTGYDLLSKQKYDVAEKFFRRYSQLQRADPNGYIALAACYHELRDQTAYLNTIDSGLMYCPGSYNLLNQKGQTLLVAGRYEEAIPYFEASLKINPNYEKASKNLSAGRHAVDSVKARK